MCDFTVLQIGCNKFEGSICFLPSDIQVRIQSSGCNGWGCIPCCLDFVFQIKVLPIVAVLQANIFLFIPDGKHKYCFRERIAYFSCCWCADGGYACVKIVIGKNSPDGKCVPQVLIGDIRPYNLFLFPVVDMHKMVFAVIAKIKEYFIGHQSMARDTGH